jgi:hypothetical protein
MRRSVLAFLALVSVGLGLVGCGRFGEQRAAWRTQAEEACMSRGLVKTTDYMSRMSSIDGPGACGMEYPFKVSAFGQGSVGLSNRLTLACPIIPEIEGWIADTVQPAAELYFGQEVSEIRAGTYNCRGRNNQPGAKISEHAFGNAMDVMSFKFADGRVVTVEKGWKGAPEEQDFLREVFVGACRHFTTVLAPGSNVYHYNHLHLDLARHDARGLRRICQPTIKFEPRIDPETGAVRRPVQPRPAIRPLPEPGEPLEIEDDEDPYAVSKGPARTNPAAPASPAVAARAAPPPAAAQTAPGTSSYAKTTARLPAASSPSRPAPVTQSPGRYAAGQYAPETIEQPKLLHPQLLNGAGVY